MENIFGAPLGGADFVRLSKKVRVIVLRTAGTNCDQETKFAFERFGSSVDVVHVNELISKVKSLSDYHILAIPGGFTYGDDVASGKILANELRLRLAEDIQKFVDRGKLIIGICNGFQILVKAGILPALNPNAMRVSGAGAGLALSLGSRAALSPTQLEEGPPHAHTPPTPFDQDVTLTTNDSARFEARWVYLKSHPTSPCVWTKGIGDTVYLPVAHGEGKFIPKDKSVLDRLNKDNQIVFRYCSPQGTPPSYPENPNGAIEDIAGICDPTGRVFGLMPHPERHFLFTQHPFWTRFEKKNELGDGARIFENGVRYVQESIL